MAENRSRFAMMINTAPTGQTQAYALIGEGVTELTISYNAQTSTEQYIHQDTATTNITGYQPNAPVTARVFPGDPAFDFINSMRKKLPIGSDAYTDIVMFDMFDEANAEGGYPATKQPVSIQIDSYGGAASDPLSVGYTINWRGSGTEGTFNPETKAFTEGVTV